MSWFNQIPKPVRVVLAVVLAALLALEGSAVYFNSSLCLEDEISTQVTADEGVFGVEGQTVFLAAFVERYRKTEGVLCSLANGGRIHLEGQATVFFTYDFATGVARRLGVIEAPDGFQLGLNSWDVSAQSQARGIVYVSVAGRKPRDPQQRQQDLKYEADLDRGEVRPLTKEEWSPRPAGVATPLTQQNPDRDRVRYVHRTGRRGEAEGGFVLERDGQPTGQGVLVSTDELAQAVEAD